MDFESAALEEHVSRSGKPYFAVLMSDLGRCGPGKQHELSTA